MAFQYFKFLWQPREQGTFSLSSEQVSAEFALVRSGDRYANIMRPKLVAQAYAQNRDAQIKN